MAEHVTIEPMWLRVAAVGVPSSVKMGCILLSDSIFLPGYALLHLVHWGTQIWRQCLILIASNAVRTLVGLLSKIRNRSGSLHCVTLLLCCVCVCVCARACVRACVRRLLSVIQEFARRFGRK